MPVGRNQIIAGVVVLAVAAAAAYVGLGAWQKRKLQADVAQLVGETGARLEATLGVDINAPTTDMLRTLDKSIEDADTALQRVRAANARHDPQLVEAADDFSALVLGVLKRQSGAARGRLKFNESNKLLAAHIANVGARGSDWLAEAVRLRQQLDKDYFDYQIAASSLENMLGGYPQSRRKIAALLPGAALPAESAVKEARARAQAALDATKQELEKAKQLIAPG